MDKLNELAINEPEAYFKKCEEEYRQQKEDAANGKHWIHIHDSDASYQDMFEVFADALGDMGIDCYEDVKKSGEDGLFIVLEKFEETQT